MAETTPTTPAELRQMTKNLAAQAFRLGQFADEMERQGFASLEIGSHKSYEEGLRRVKMFTQAVFNAINNTETNRMMITAEELAEYKTTNPRSIEEEHQHRLAAIKQEMAAKTPNQAAGKVTDKTRKKNTG